MNGEAARRGARRGDLRWPGAIAVAGATLACVAVAIAAEGEPLRGADARISRLNLSPWLLAIPILAVAVLGLLALASFRRVGGVRLRKRRPLWLTLVGVVAFVGLLSLLRPARPEGSPPPPSFEVAAEVAPGERHDTAWPAWLAVAAGSLLALGAIVSRRRIPAPADEPDAADPAADARRTLDESLADLAEPGEPRQAVIAAYARLLEGLHDAGAGRQPAEAPFEHVARVLAQLGVRPGPLRELTGLFAEARFSSHPITEAHRQAAVRALADARADLEGVRAG